MTAPAIPPALEEQVYDFALRSMTSRWIADWLQKKHGIPCSHTAVLSCIRRVREEKEAVQLESLGDDPPVTSSESLRQVLKASRRIARRAAQKGDMWAGIAALNVQLGVERLRSRRRPGAEDVAPVPDTLPTTLPGPFHGTASVADLLGIRTVSSPGEKGAASTVPDPSGTAGESSATDAGLAKTPPATCTRTVAMAGPKERTFHASAVMLTRTNNGARELYWVQRSREVSLGGGFFAFPGGRLDEADVTLAASFGRNDLDGALLVTAMRELFEETGVFLGPVPAGVDLKPHRERLLSEEGSFGDVLNQTRAALNPALLQFAGRWLTPPFIPTRFDTRFYVAEVPAGQSPEVWKGELAKGEWITPTEALARWTAGKALLHPPATHLIECLRDAPVAEALPRMRQGPHLIDYVAQRIEFQKGILLAPVRTPTLPPATHTNCYIVGEEELVVIDPASPYEDEQARLLALCEGLRAEGRRFREIILTHHHHDHVSGANVLREKLGIPVRAHPITAELLKDSVTVDGFIQPDEIVALPGTANLRLRAVFTPGHDPGHLCFFDETTGSLITGDMIAGIGSIVVDPPEGDMGEYVASLKLLRSLPVNAVYPAHGPTIPDGPAKIDEYIAHRAEREAKVVDALSKAGVAAPTDLVPHVYADVAPALYPFAARSLTAVIDKLVKEQRVTPHADGRFELIRPSAS